ncbi:MAG: endo-1,4-beta-xylanase [Propionibacteriaceae bacterium]|jgi:GH35 family endo-1,4-beta-xylanase|nr:endo-1,4-beta-xylanase [Propionibacteriaceae bacterium]
MNVVSCPDVTLGARLGDTLVTVVDGAGRPLADTDIAVAQVRHEFWFGNIAFDLAGLANGEAGERSATAAEADLWLGLFDTATLPFYWGQYEPAEGSPAVDRLRTAAAWLAARGVRLKGHPLAWHTLAPDWLLGRPLDEVERLLRARITREVGTFRGLVDAWDAINEVVIMPVFANGDNAITPLARARGRIAMVRLAVETARAANPGAFLLLNDFDLGSAFECLIEGVLEAGVRLDAIGLQTHMHQGYRGEAELLEVADRFARYGLPLHFTETSLVSGHLMPPEIVDLNDYQVAAWPSTPEGEARQADELVRHYRSLAGHPAVAALTYWGLTDRDAWLGAPIGLLRADGSPKPGYHALKNLVRGDWWVAPSATRTDGQGAFRLRAFRGDYRVTGLGRTGGFALGGEAQTTCRLS